MELIDMKLPVIKESEKCVVEPGISSSEGPRWPYGLQIRFESEQVEKMPSLTEYKVGDKIVIQAEATVTSIRMSQRQNGEEENSVEMQIEKIGCTLAVQKPAEKLNPKEYRSMREGRLWTLGEVKNES